MHHKMKGTIQNRTELISGHQDSLDLPGCQEEGKKIAQGDGTSREMQEDFKKSAVNCIELQ